MFHSWSRTNRDRCTIHLLRWPPCCNCTHWGLCNRGCRQCTNRRPQSPKGCSWSRQGWCIQKWQELRDRSCFRKSRWGWTHCQCPNRHHWPTPPRLRSTCSFHRRIDRSKCRLHNCPQPQACNNHRADTKTPNMWFQCPRKGHQTRPLLPRRWSQTMWSLVDTGPSKWSTSLRCPNSFQTTCSSCCSRRFRLWRQPM